jgi:hypothetical protein
VQEKEMSGDSTMAVRPLFQEEGDGAKPISPLQLILFECTQSLFVHLNSMWHSRLPDAGGFYGNGVFFAAEYANAYYATAAWSVPIAIAFNGKPYLELRRFAISSQAPKNTASRLLSVMVRMIRKKYPNIERLISYQDTAVHNGTIYKAQGWKATRISKAGEQNWVKTHPRASARLQTDTSKIRWELPL